MASTKLTRTFSADSNRKKFTVSVWVKKSQDASAKAIWGGEISTGYVWLLMGSTLYFQQNPSSTIEFNSTEKFRDASGWYHIVQQVDTAQATASNRMKFWVNGEQITNWATSTYPSQNEDIKFQSAAYPIRIGEFGNSYWDGSMSHFHWCDGYAYQASDFGSTDATTGEWKINTSPSVSYGTNGFWILKDGNSVTDSSPNSNNFTVSAGTLTKTEDCPSNVFATFNPLATFANITLTNGNNTYTLNAGTWESTPSTLAVPSSGKYYAEFKWNASSTSAQYMMVGVDSPQLFSNWSTQYPGYTSVGYAYGWDGDKRNNGNNSSYGAAWGATSIIGVAIDMDNKKLYFHKDGVYQNSGVPTSGSTGTGALSLTGNEYYLIVSGYKNSENPSIHANFGNGYFGTTAVSSAGTNASNNGIFEYDVPTGYTALSTKGLNL
tara:strand:+ start:717 stop:2021 length:1305 start_codon:yes stop_codon:yes gene_type:complete